MNESPTNSQNSEDAPQSVSTFRAVIVFGMLGFGTFFGVLSGLFSYFLFHKDGNLLCTLAAYVLMGWFIGIFVGWTNRVPWGVL